MCSVRSVCLCACMGGVGGWVRSFAAALAFQEEHTALLRSQLGRQVSTQALRQPSCPPAHHLNRPLPMGHVGNEHIRSLNSRSIQLNFLREKQPWPAEGWQGCGRWRLRRLHGEGDRKLKGRVEEDGCQR